VCAGYGDGEVDCRLAGATPSTEAHVAGLDQNMSVHPAAPLLRAPADVCLRGAKERAGPLGPARRPPPAGEWCHTEQPGTKNQTSSGNPTGQPILGEILDPRHNAIATNTLNAVRQQLSAEEPELRLGVRHLAVFGSAARGDDRADSDVDLAVEIEAGRSISLISMDRPVCCWNMLCRAGSTSARSTVSRPPVRAAFERERVAILLMARGNNE
jgi:hypothetical protein